MKSRFAVVRKWLIFWTLFAGISALGGAVYLLIDPSGRSTGLDGVLAHLQTLPDADRLFRSFTVSAVTLLAVIAIPNFTAAALLIMRRWMGVLTGAWMGVALMAWSAIQFFAVPGSAIAVAYFAAGAAQGIAGFFAWVYARQEAFAAELNMDDYPNVGGDPRILVAYFSRIGYVRHIAVMRANLYGCDLYEIRARVPTGGTLGFWRCALYGLFRRDMPIEEVGVDFSRYRHVTICSPIWAFGLASPVRAFCREVRGRVRSVDYILIHRARPKYNNAVREMNELLGLKPLHVLSSQCRTGRFKMTGRELR